MLAFAVRRTAQVLAVLVAISAVTFALFYAGPQDAARSACGAKCDAAAVASIRHGMGLDQAVPAQYWHYLSGLVAGRTLQDINGAPVACPAPCLGYSYFLHEPVVTAIGQAFPVTLSLTLGAVLVLAVIGGGTGFLSALFPRSWLDRALNTFTLVGASVQLIFIGYAVQYYLVYQAHLLPQPGYTSPWHDPAGWFRGMLVPWLMLGWVSAAVYARLARTQMLDTMGEEYIRTARSKGMGWWQAHLKYTARGSAAPLVQLIGLEIGWLLGGSVIAETVFGLNGVGKLALTAITQNDLPTVVGTVLLAALFVVVFVALTDCLIALLDPRIRLS
ncbi:ABC transporter permease [Streptomyces sp. SID13666]|uniref:ABC transporter permease n=1 Tax=unclassified Streptomyces TaxID=2593676 RepID=UPI0013C2209B|nr:MULTISPECIES: ABC transporter permease [unclassified Streptomyces]NEA54250.1 ABC transporter permease [Streptomyces sp. SID13666]NEA70345.1 ABC transporter permease [Streptomyces sp. SID13588]